MNTPVAFLIYRRPELTRRVFAAIAAARPPRLLVVADGPKSATERAACEAARAAATAVTWPCRVETRFAERNLGCRTNVASGLTWVFEQVAEAIVVEDDCLPDPSFFPFCEAMLARYRDDPRVGHIGALDLNRGAPRGAGSYYFSRYASIWGWATWRRCWQDYDVALRQWPALKAAGAHRRYFPSRATADFVAREFDAIHAGKLDTWDWQWQLCCLQHERLCIVPNGNLVTNLGFDSDASHPHNPDNPFRGLSVNPMTFPLRHPARVAADARADRLRGNQGRELQGPLQRLAAALGDKHRYGKLLRRVPGVGPAWSAWRARRRNA